MFILFAIIGTILGIIILLCGVPLMLIGLFLDKYWHYVLMAAIVLDLILWARRSIRKKRSQKELPAP